MSAGALPAAMVMVGTGVDAVALDPVVDAFRAAVSGGGGNNGVGGGPFADGRREVAWDVASADPFQTPAEFPGTFFNAFSPRGLQLTTPGSLRISGRAASGSPDVLFSTLNAPASAEFQAFTPERLLAVYGETVVETRFFLPSTPSQSALVRGFGVVFADVSIFGPTRLSAFGRNGDLLADVIVPAAPGGLSFAGVWIDSGQWIDRVRIVAGEAGIEGNAAQFDIVAVDDFIYSEPQLVPEAGVPGLILLAGAATLARRSRS